MTLEQKHAVTDEELEALNKRSLFIRDAHPGEWLGYANDLASAAETLWNDRTNAKVVGVQSKIGGELESAREENKHERSYILLAGLALENALKGLILADNPSLIDTGALAGPLKSHKLVGLARRVRAISLTDAEIAVLTTCQDAIPYWGRYPIPVEYADVLPSQAASQKFRATFRALIHRVCLQIYAKIRNGWGAGVGQAARYLSAEFEEELYNASERPDGTREPFNFTNVINAELAEFNKTLDNRPA